MCDSHFPPFFSVSRHILGPTMYFLIFLICQFSRHIPGPTVCVSPFPCFSVFLPYSGSNTVCFHFPHFNVSRHIPGSTLCVSHICFVLQVYRHIPGPTVCNSHFPPFSVFLAIFPVKECLCLIFHVFSVFSPYSKSYTVHFSISMYFSVSYPIPDPKVSISHFPRFTIFLAIFQVLHWAFLIFQVFQFFLPYSCSYSVCVSFSTFFSFVPIIQVPQCSFLIFHVFQCFSTNSRYYCVIFSFFFQVYRHIPGPTVCSSHFPPFSVFLAIFQVIQCLCLIFHDFQFSRHIPGLPVCYSHFLLFQCFLKYFTTYSMCFTFSMIFTFLTIFQVLQCAFFIFHVHFLVSMFSVFFALSQIL